MNRVLLFYQFYYFIYITAKGKAYTLQNKAIVSFHPVFKVIVYYLILYPRTLCEFVTADTVFVKSLI